jgi:hypothetical protein
MRGICWPLLPPVSSGRRRQVRRLPGALFRHVVSNEVMAISRRPLALDGKMPS